MPAPKKKVTLYFSSGLLEETQREAIRQDRSISWVIQAAWRLARDEVRRLPGVAGVNGVSGVASAGAAAVPPSPAPSAAPPPPPVVAPTPLRAKARGG